MVSYCHTCLSPGASEHYDGHAYCQYHMPKPKTATPTDVALLTNALSRLLVALERDNLMISIASAEDIMFAKATLATYKVEEEW